MVLNMYRPRPTNIWQKSWSRFFTR